MVPHGILEEYIRTVIKYREIYSSLYPSRKTINPSSENPSSDINKKKLQEESDKLTERINEISKEMGLGLDKMRELNNFIRENTEKNTEEILNEWKKIHEKNLKEKEREK